MSDAVVLWSQGSPAPLGREHLVVRVCVGGLAVQRIKWGAVEARWGGRRERRGVQGPTVSRSWLPTIETSPAKPCHCFSFPLHHHSHLGYFPGSIASLCIESLSSVSDGILTRLRSTRSFVASGLDDTRTHLLPSGCREIARAGLSGGLLRETTTACLIRR
jgi:hypothetical protein